MRLFATAIEFVSTLDRQFGGSIYEKLSTKTPEVVEHIVSAPVHNMRTE